MPKLSCNFSAMSSMRSLSTKRKIQVNFTTDAKERKKKRIEDTNNKFVIKLF